MENLIQKWTQLGLFSLPKLEHSFQFKKKRAGESSPSFLIVHLSVWLNMRQYPLICLNILENAWINWSDYVEALKMPDHLICLTGFWRCSGGNNRRSTVIDQQDLIHDCPKSFYYDQDDCWVFPRFKNKVFV